MAGDRLGHLVQKGEGALDSLEGFVERQGAVAERPGRHPAAPQVGIEQRDLVAGAGRAEADDRLIQRRIVQAVAATAVAGRHGGS